LTKHSEEKQTFICFKQYKAEEIQKKIEQKLEQISNEREELLKEAWSIAYKLCDDKEKQKSNMVS